MFEALKLFFQAPDWTSLFFVVVDLTIVYYIIYQVLLLIKGTRAVQMLIGLLAIIIVFFVSKPDLFNLPTLNWLLDSFLSSLFLIIIVIFQDDIRRVLSQVGQPWDLSKLTSRAEENQNLEEIIKAAANLSKEQIGALIVVQRDADLQSYIEKGATILDAQLSAELLVSLFVTRVNGHNNPLHDKAVVVRGDRVLAAGVVLPLTQKTSLDRTLGRNPGTRHRAAIGMSEETDAAIVVVSEETGNISVAFERAIERQKDLDMLRETLQAIFNRSAAAKEAKEAAARVRRGLWWRLLSLSNRAQPTEDTHEEGSKP